MIKMKINKYTKSVFHLRKYSFYLTVMTSLVLIFVFLGATSYLYLPSTSTNPYRQALEESFRQENVQQEWKRLYKYHGNPAVVIYEEGKTPYFYDKQGNECAFIAPQGAVKPININHPAEDSEDYTTLTFNPNPLLESTRRQEFPNEQKHVP